MDDEDGRGFSRKPEDNMNEDMPSMDDLKTEAQIICEQIGHTMGNWQDFQRCHKMYSLNTCLVCYRTVQVCENPSSEEKDIEGTAYTDFCNDE